jgi:hypothetical protein
VPGQDDCRIMTGVSYDLPYEAPGPEKSRRPESSRPPGLVGPDHTTQSVVDRGNPQGDEICDLDAPSADMIATKVGKDLTELPGGGPERQADANADAPDPEQVLAIAANFLGSVEMNARRRAITEFSNDAVETVVKALSVAVRELGSETVIGITRALAADPKHLDMLLYISRTSEVKGPARLPVSRRFRLAAAALLAFGIGVPLLAPPAGEIVLNNELIAIGALVAAVAALFRS